MNKLRHYKQIDDNCTVLFRPSWPHMNTEVEERLYSHLRQSHKCGIIVPRQSAQTRITSERSILASNSGILQIECVNANIDGK